MHGGLGPNLTHKYVPEYQWKLSHTIDRPQQSQLDNAMDIFEFKNPNCVGVWIFDCSSNHEGFAPDALNAAKMNVGPGGKQSLPRDTIILLDNPPPKPGLPDI